MVALKSIGRVLRMLWEDQRRMRYIRSTKKRGGWIDHWIDQSRARAETSLSRTFMENGGDLIITLRCLSALLALPISCRDAPASVLYVTIALTNLTLEGIWLLKRTLLQLLAGFIFSRLFMITTRQSVNYVVIATASSFACTPHLG